MVQFGSSCAFGRHSALLIGVAFGGSVCLARPASEVHTFVLDFRGMGWARDGPGGGLAVRHG